jgi:murein DD-endopeptidase MepM/ murein hydrolase activator NlpD
VLDYNGGTRTYDTHRGTDYALSPFRWNKLDAGEVQVVAAADGTLINKVNGDPTDHNCNVSSNDTWNYVALLHADGRLTIYGHMRYNSLTSKGVGATVVQGEYLGTAASSGDSSGPHLHFEMRYGSFSTAEWMDPYAGPNSQPASVWANQPPYYDSAINKLATHASPPSTPNPCQPSILNLQNSFTPLSNIYLYAYYRDYQGTLSTQLKLYRPDGSVYKSWEYTPGSPAFSSEWKNGWVENLSAN